MVEALFHQDWVKQYEFTCWGSSRKNQLWWQLRLTGFPHPCQSRFQGERSPNLHSDRKDWGVVWLLLCSSSSATTVNGGCWKWAMSTFWNQKLLKVEKLQAVNSSYCSAAHCFTQTAWGDPGMHGNECNKEGICQVVKTVKDQTFFFWQGEKGNSKNIWKTKRRTETGGNNDTQKRMCISDWAMEILATVFYTSKSISGLRKQDNISMVIRITTMLIVNLMNILCCLITIYSVMDYC